MKRKNWPMRIICALLFLALSGLIMLSIYTLSSEDNITSGNRSNVVTEALKEQVAQQVETTPEGLALSQFIQAKIIQYSPYGSDWQINVRKVGHFTIYFALATMGYITLAILGVNKFLRIVFILAICGGFAYFDEVHQSYVAGRVMSYLDMIVDVAGAFVSVALLTAISIVYSFIAWISKAIFEH